MNQIELVKRAAKLVWRYRVLWLFGILLALTSGSGGPNFNYTFGNNKSSGAPFDGFPSWSGINGTLAGTEAGIIALCCCLLLLFAIGMTIVQYVSKAALIRSVDQIEGAGSAPTWREGFRLGWTHRTFRLFLLDLIVAIPLMIGVLLLMAFGAAPLLLMLIDTTASRVVGIGGTVLLEILMFFVIIAICTIVGVLGQFWSREVLLANRSIGEALSGGYRMVRGRIKDIGVMWLLMFGIGIGWGLILLPIVFGVLAVSGMAGAALGFSVYAMSSVTWISVVLGIIVFGLIAAIPLALINGLYMAFDSSAWTLTYREVVAKEAPALLTDQ